MKKRLKEFLIGCAIPSGIIAAGVIAVLLFNAIVSFITWDFTIITWWGNSVIHIFSLPSVWRFILVVCTIGGIFAQGSSITEEED